MKKNVIFLLFVVLLNAFINPALAIYKGQSAIGNSFVVRLYIDNSYTCSGAIISENIVVTAGHCVLHDGVISNLESISVTLPGVNTSISKTRFTPIAIQIPDDYENWDSSISPSDIAFLLFSTKIVDVPTLQLADYSLSREVYENVSEISVYGYGKVNSSQSTDSPFFYVARKIPQKRISGFAGYENSYFNLSNDENGSTCPGDSGGPSVATYKNQLYLIGVHSGSSGPCNSNGNSTWGATETFASYFIELKYALEDKLDEIRPLPVENAMVSLNQNFASITWQKPYESVLKIDSFEVLDETSNSVCKSFRTECTFEIKKLGGNSFSIVSIANNVRSKPVLISFDAENSETPKFDKFEVHREFVNLKWLLPTNMGNVNPESIEITIYDDEENFLCSAPLHELGCSIPLIESTRRIYISSESNLGKTKKEYATRFAGQIDMDRISRIESLNEKLRTDIATLVSNNPGYSNELNNLLSSVPLISEDFIYSQEEWNNLLKLNSNLSALSINIILHPRKIAIQCIKGSTKKVVVGVNPKCPKGFKRKN